MGDFRGRYLVLTWGCQMNDDDSRQMCSLLEALGYEKAECEDDADIIILNTCSVRARPEQKVRTKLGELRLLKETKPGLIVGLAGCMAQRLGGSVRARAPHINIIIGTANVHELPSLIERVRKGERRVTSLDLPESGKEAGAARRIDGAGLKEFVPVMYGCDNFCAYCVVPYARGRERSRPSEDVVGEVRTLVEKGCREVMLVGQNVNSYGRFLSEKIDFAGLLSLVNGVDGLERIRFITSHPKDISGALIDAMASLPKVCEHLHLPLQAGDDDVLGAMGRGYTLGRFREIVDRLRDRVSGISITTDVMVGFPSETEGQFENTMRAVEDIRFDAAFTFAFNARPGTKAAEMGGQIDMPTKMRRLRELIDLQNRITMENMERLVGTELEVLAEGPSEKDASKTAGYTRTNRTVVFDGFEGEVGSVVKVRIESAHPWGFMGFLADARRRGDGESGRAGEKTR